MFTPLRSLEQISSDLKSLDVEISQLSQVMSDVSYERYRDVQSFWVSQVPEHWTTQKNNIFTQKKEIAVTSGNLTLLTMGKTGVNPEIWMEEEFPESFETTKSSIQIN